MLEKLLLICYTNFEENTFIYKKGAIFMKTLCCACGKPIKMSILTGNEGHELQGKAYACYDCCKIAGYGKGVMGAMGTACLTRETFVQKYKEAIAQEELRKQEELEAKRKIKEARQEKVESAKKLISSLKTKLGNQTETPESLQKSETTSIEMLSDEELIKKCDSFIVKNPGIMLMNEEKCFYQGSCYSARLKNVLTGTSGNSVRVGGKSAFGMYVSTGTSQRSYDRSTVAEKYPGTFYITNNRMICSAPKLAFEIKLTNITSLTTYTDALIITAKDKSYIVETQDVEIIKELLAVNNEGIKRGLTNKEPICNNSTNNDNQITSEEKKIQLLREYKGLCDEGIITQEEFEKKKAELLGL